MTPRDVVGLFLFLAFIAILFLLWQMKRTMAKEDRDQREILREVQREERRR